MDICERVRQALNNPARRSTKYRDTVHNVPSGTKGARTDTTYQPSSSPADNRDSIHNASSRNERVGPDSTDNLTWNPYNLSRYDAASHLSDLSSNASGLSSHTRDLTRYPCERSR